MPPVTNEQLLKAIEESRIARESDMATMKQQVLHLTQLAEESNRAIRGHDGETGLAADVEALRVAMDTHIANEKTCPIGRVVPVLFGNPEKQLPGMIATVDEIVKWRKTLKRWYYVGVSAIVVGVVNIILALLLEYFKRGGGP